MTTTNYRKPRTGDALLRVQWANGNISIHTYTASQLRWTNTGSDFDIIACERAK